MSDTPAPRTPREHIPLHDLLGLEFVRPEGPGSRAEVRMPVRPESFGANHNLHGGAIATMVDLACALAATRQIDLDRSKESLVTVDMHVRYLGQPRRDEVIARAEVVRAGRQLVVIECRVADHDPRAPDAASTEGHLIAVADFSMMRVPLRRPLLDPPAP